MTTPFLCPYFDLWEVDFMTLKEELDKHYQELLKEIENEEKKQRKRIAREINKALFWHKVKKILFGINFN